MIRDRLGSYGLELSDAQLGAALAGELTQPSVERAWAGPRGRIAKTVKTPDGTWLHTLLPAHANAAQRAFCDAAARVAQALPTARYGLALALQQRAGTDGDPALSRALLAALAVGTSVSAAHLVTAAAHPPAEWLWPLDAAFFDDEASIGLRRQLERASQHRFIAPMRAASATAPIELLICPHTLEEALRQTLQQGRLPRVQAVLVLGGCGPDGQAIGLAERLRLAANADAVCIAAVPPPAQRALIDDMLADLAHDIDLDVAFAQACRKGNLALPLMIGCAGAFARAHVSQWAQHVAARLSRLRPVVLPQAPRLGLNAHWSNHAARELLSRVPLFRFERESGEATDLAVVGNMARHAMPNVATRERRLQAELWTGDGENAQQVKTAPLLPSRAYELTVWIGPPSGDSIVAPVAFPDESLPPRVEGHELTIAVTAPGVLDTPQIRSVHLPATGESDRTRVAFTLPALGVQARLVARITVLHENRVLQTLLLDAAIGDGTDGAHEPLVLTLESVLRRDLDGVEGRRRFDAALLFNDLAGVSSMSVFVDDRASLIDIEDVSQQVSAVASILEDATNDPLSFGDPSTEATTQLLAKLARRGSLLRRGLFDMPDVQADLQHAQRIQIVSAKPEAVLPIEVCYDPLPPSADAVICPEWRTALNADPPACSDKCPADMRTVVCPIGFWGTRRVIERHIYRKADARKLTSHDFALQSEPTSSRQRLPVLHGGLCAAAAAARAQDAKAVDGAFQAAATAAQAIEVRDWGSWRAAITDKKPSLLLLLAHTDSQDDLSTLVIGQDDAALLTDLDQRFVGGADGAGPLVVLLGCSTAVEKPRFESFITEFRRSGAAIVIGTLCKILGRHAGPIAKALVDQLALAAQDSDGVPLGEYMTRLRRRMLADGIPIVLTVIAFGDADWII